MSEIPGKLRAAREAAGLTVEDISARTKIKVQFIRAMEQGSFDHLPGEFFARSFLKNYAAEVGLSPEEIAAEFDAERTPPVEDFEPELAPIAVAPARPFRVAMPPIAGLGRPRNGLPVVVLTLVVLVGLFALNRPGRTVTAGTPGAVGTSGVAEAAPAPAPPAPQPEAVPDKLTIDMRPTAATWVTAVSDDQRLFSRLVEAGEQVSVQAQRQLMLRVGNAGGFEYTVNGVPGKPIGVSGEVKELQITKDNYREFRRQ